MWVVHIEAGLYTSDVQMINEYRTHLVLVAKLEGRHPPKRYFR
jgi:hypothetical protein